MEMIKHPLDLSLEENYRELRAKEQAEHRVSKTYSPNGSREVARRLRQIERRQLRAAEPV